MASICSVNRKLGLVLVCLAAIGFGCDDDNAADHDDEHSPHDHAGTTGSTAGVGGEHAHGGTETVGPLTGAKCPSAGTQLTYENFAKKFMADYCLSCHSEKVTGAARMKAPEDHNFDTFADVDLIHTHIDQKAGSGPDHTNTAMPPADAAKKPTMEERQKLSEWIACGNPEK